MGKVCFDDILYIILYNLFMYIILKLKKMDVSRNLRWQVKYSNTIWKF